MVIRFFILQTQYRSTLDFSNEALQAAEKGLRRLWDAYEKLQGLTYEKTETGSDAEQDKRINRLLDELDDFMNDDFNTAKVLANIFELVPLINSMKDKTISTGVISPESFQRLKVQLRLYLEDILGLQSISGSDNDKLEKVLQLLMDIRKEAKGRKDFTMSDKIRNQLSEVGILLKDEKDGGTSFSIES